MIILDRELVVLPELSIINIYIIEKYSKFLYNYNRLKKLIQLDL